MNVLQYLTSVFLEVACGGGGHPGVIDAGHGCIPLGSPRYIMVYLGILCPNNSNTFSDGKYGCNRGWAGQLGQL